MAEKEFTFVDAEHVADDALTAARNLNNADDAESVADLVKKVRQQLGPNDCIKRLVIFGHGRPGSINVGAGKGRDGTKRKSISLENIAEWEPQIRKLFCRFCEDGELILWGCAVGGDMRGSRLLRLLRNFIVCARIKAPAAPVLPWVYESGIRIQVAEPGSVNLPEEIPAELPETKTRGKLNMLPAGKTWESMRNYAVDRIVAARFFDRPPGRKDEPILELSGPALNAIRTEWRKAETAFAPLALYMRDGALQFAISLPGGKSKWLPPGAVLGGGRLYSPAIGDSSLVLVLPKVVQRSLAKVIYKIPT